MPKILRSFGGSAGFVDLSPSPFLCKTINKSNLSTPGMDWPLADQVKEPVLGQQGKWDQDHLPCFSRHLQALTGAANHQNHILSHCCFSRTVFLSPVSHTQPHSAETAVAEAPALCQSHSRWLKCF